MRSYWNEHSKQLKPLQVGDLVRIQNQFRPHPLKWDRTGVIVEVKQHDQYVVKIDGSSRSTLRNRKFLRRYERSPVHNNKTDLLEKLRFVRSHHTSLAKSGQIDKRKSIPSSSNHTDDLPLNDANLRSPQVQEKPPANSADVPPCVQDEPPTRITEADREAVPTSSKKKVPLALRCLAPHNNKGLKEQ